MNKEEDIRDPEILDEFEFADYLMKNVLGYFLYVSASVQGASSEDKTLRLPKALPFTHDWLLTYSPDLLVKEMDEQFGFYHTRSCLIALAGIFEVTLRSFAARLNEKRSDSAFRGIDPENSGYKTLLKRAFDFIIANKGSLYSGGDKRAIERVPDLCCDVDNVRRLRNLFMHNRGLFNSGYETDAIKIRDRQPKMYPKFSDLQKDSAKKVAVLLTSEEYISYSRSHIQLLHNLHDLIQRKYFGLTDSGYYYPREQPRRIPKIAGWDRIFTDK